MSKIIDATYDAKEKAFRVEDDQEWVTDGARVQLLALLPEENDSKRPWPEFRGYLSKEAGDSLAAAIDEMFPPWDKCEE